MPRDRLEEFRTNRCREERDQLGAEIDESFRHAKGLLEQLTSQNQRLPPNSPDTNARKGRTAAVTRQFQEVVERYREIEDSYWNKSRDRLKRQYKVAKPLATEEEIDQALDDERAGQVFTQSLLTSTRVGDARRVLREVETRQQEMRQIEKKALELNALFIRLNEIVNAQQETVDNIEINIQKITADVRDTNRQTEEAINIRRKTRTKLWVLLGIGALIVVVVVVVIVITKNTK
ncbi:hypothetical protein H4R35_003205 [Dimargaris xerosporica]|nr:hypothetical protein H4R35_003205 [Dimargaris xerosporica]